MRRIAKSLTKEEWQKEFPMLIILEKPMKQLKQYKIPSKDLRKFITLNKIKTVYVNEAVENIFNNVIDENYITVRCLMGKKIFIPEV